MCHGPACVPRRCAISPRPHRHASHPMDRPARAYAHAATGHTMVHACAIVDINCGPCMLHSSANPPPTRYAVHHTPQLHLVHTERSCGATPVDRWVGPDCGVRCVQQEFTSMGTTAYAQRSRDVHPRAHNRLHSRQPDRHVATWTIARDASRRIASGHPRTSSGAGMRPSPQMSKSVACAQPAKRRSESQPERQSQSQATGEAGHGWRGRHGWTTDMTDCTRPTANDQRPTGNGPGLSRIYPRPHPGPHSQDTVQEKSPARPGSNPLYAPHPPY